MYIQSRGPHTVVQVQARAAQALCGVFTGCPRLMLLAQRSGLLARLLRGALAGLGAGAAEAAAAAFSEVPLFSPVCISTA